MAYVQTETATPSEVIQAVLTKLRDGQINEAIACFAPNFQFNDRGIGLEFKNREHLAEFFEKMRELYPNSSLKTDRILTSGDYVVTEWTLKTTLTEPFYGGLSRKLTIALPGVSIARIENRKITDWADYYDGLTARRTALTAHFVKWVEL
jgi:limonene-1,2-epoxide hydrolase